MQERGEGREIQWETESKVYEEVERKGVEVRVGESKSESGNAICLTESNLSAQSAHSTLLSLSMRAFPYHLCEYIHAVHYEYKLIHTHSFNAFYLYFYLHFLFSFILSLRLSWLCQSKH